MGFSPDFQPAYTTKDGGSFGFIVKTDKPIAVMYAMLEGTEWGKKKFGCSPE